MAKIYQKRGKIADAINTEKKNLLLIKNMGDNKTYPIHLMIMAQYYLLDKQYNNAKECVEQAIQFDGDQHNIANYKPVPIQKEFGNLNFSHTTIIS